MDRVPEAPAPDADTPADTIKTLTANVAAMTTEVEALRQDNAGLRRENQELLRNRTQIEENVSTRIKRELLAREKDAANRARIDSGVLSSLSAKVDALAASVDEAKSSRQGSQIPVGVGLNGAGEGSADAIVWIEPLDAIGEDGEGGLFDRVKQGTGNAWDSARSTGTSAVDGIGDRIEDLQPVPVYTVPRNATLIGSTAMTALVGRVPIQGQVRDPMPFKVITGAENLAANGLRVPGVQGMVWSGTAIGDWTLSCVTGRVYSVTFVFDDGTIRTLSSDDRQNANQSQSGGEDKPLGWISDARGIPRQFELDAPVLRLDLRCAGDPLREWGAQDQRPGLPLPAHRGDGHPGGGSGRRRGGNDLGHRRLGERHQLGDRRHRHLCPRKDRGRGQRRGGQVAARASVPELRCGLRPRRHQARHPRGPRAAHRSEPQRQETPACHSPCRPFSPSPRLA
jgi:hypothetical protein